MELGKIIWEQPHLMSKILYEFRGLTTPSAIAFKTDCIVSNTLYNEQQITSFIFQPEGFTHFQCVISFNKHRFRLINMTMDEDEFHYYDFESLDIMEVFDEYNNWEEHKDVLKMGGERDYDDSDFLTDDRDYVWRGDWSEDSDNDSIEYCFKYDTTYREE